MIVYFNGEYLDKDDVRIHPDDRGWLFADGVYEVVRFYHGQPFRMTEHVDRLQRSLDEVEIRLVEPVDLIAIGQELAERNGHPVDASLYIQITRGVAPRLDLRMSGVPPTVYISLDPVTLDPARFREGYGVLMVPDTRWARCDIKTINLLPNLLARKAAHEAGCGEAVFVRDQRVTEGTKTSVISVRDGVVLTSPITDNILPSITRSILLQLCKEAGIPVLAEGLTVPGFLASDEAMLLGTITEITPINEILVSEEVGELLAPVRFDTPGPVTRKLQAAYKEIIARECES